MKERERDRACVRVSRGPYATIIPFEPLYIVKWLAHLWLNHKGHLSSLKKKTSFDL